jgi:alpha-beta hydrolase superfamily lysophospholipase
VDMLKAVTEYLKEEKIAFNERLFMLGYSEGGYVTMAAQQSIEERPIEGLSLKAVAAGAGGYDITGMLNSMVSRETYGDPAYLAFILHSYNVTNAWNRQMSEFFKSAYASKVAGLLDGSRDSDAVNEQLSTSPATLLDATFYANIQNPNEEKVLKAALAANSLTNWAPKTSTRLYHGTADETVFYENSQLTFQKLKASGAASISLTPIPGGTHESAILPMMMDAITWFQSLDK